MTTKHNVFMLAAEKLAKAAPKVAGAQIGSVLVLKNRIIGQGQNQLKTHPNMLRWGKNKDSIFIHSEVACIHNALRNFEIEDLRRSKLYVCRVKVNGDWGLAKPCSGCQSLSLFHDIRDIFYSVDGTDKAFEQFLA